MSEDIEVEIAEDEEASSKRKLVAHSNLWALLYVWSAVITLLAVIGGAIYWFGVMP